VGTGYGLSSVLLPVWSRVLLGRQQSKSSDCIAGFDGVLLDID